MAKMVGTRNSVNTKVNNYKSMNKKMIKDETTALQQFGKLLMEEVRDGAIFGFNQIIEDNFVSEEDKYLYSIINQDKITKEDLVKIVTEMIDRTIFSVLYLFDNNEDFSIAANLEKNSGNLTEISDSLTGKIYTKNGWIKKYSEFEQIDDWIK